MHVSPGNVAGRANDLVNQLKVCFIFSHSLSSIYFA